MTTATIYLYEGLHMKNQKGGSVTDSGGMMMLNELLDGSK